MTKHFKYIALAFLICAFSSCTMHEEYDVFENNGEILFVAQPIVYNISGHNTEVLTSKDEINRLYFLLSDEKGEMIEKQEINSVKYPVIADPMEQDQLSCAIKRKANYSKATAYYIANININLDDIKDKSDLDNIIVSFNASNIGVNIPEEGIPMIGKAEIDLSNASVVTIDLQRLLAKVEVNLTVTNGATFDIESYTIHNLPTQIPLTTELNSPDTAGMIEQTIKNSVTEPTASLTFSFYMPEYVPVPSAVTKEMEKPSKSPDDPLYITIEGTFNHSKYAPAPIKYDIYLGEDNHSNFNIIRNTYYQNSIIINGVDDAVSGDDKRVIYGAYNLADQGEAANCYIISKPGRYMFPACRGHEPDNTIEGIKLEPDSTIVTGKILYSDVAGNSLENIRLVKYKNKDYIRFDLNIGSDRVVDGNTVLAVQDDKGNILWSWHLWFSSEVPGVDTYPNDAILMDRNLGAGPNNNLHPVAGLYYQYGHKEPFFKSSQNISNYHGIGANSSDTWDDDNKTITDPCPPGYKIPSDGVWNTILNDAITRYVFDSSFLYYEKNNVRYPYTYHLEENEAGEMYLKTREPITHPNQDSQEVKGSYGLGNYSASYRIQINYGGTTSYLESILHSKGKMILCEYAYYDIDIKNVKYSLYFKIGSTEKSVTNMSHDELMNYEIVLYKGSWLIPKISFQIKQIPNIESLLDNILQTLKNSSNQNMIVSKKDIEPNHGLQIRCVREDSPVQ